jgi:hypothetical protein
MKMIERGSAIDTYRYDSALMICGKLRANVSWHLFQLPALIQYRKPNCLGTANE